MKHNGHITEKKKRHRLVAHMVVEQWTHKVVVEKMAGNMVDSKELVEVVQLAGHQLQDRR